MRPYFKLIAFLGFFLFFQHTLFAQRISNEGTDFWLCFPDHVPSDDKLATLSLFITSKTNSSGKVTCGSSTQSFTVKANTVTEVFVPRDASFIGPGIKISENKGIHIKVDEGMGKVVVYAHVFAGFRSAATLVLPTEALGRKYFAMAYEQIPQTDGFLSQLAVVAVEPQTTFKLTPVIGGVKQSAISVTLENVGDVYQFQNKYDVTGSLVEVDSAISGCKRIAVFSGSSAIGINTPTCNIFPQNGSADPLLQQLYPIESWGKIFPVVPFYGRDAGSIFRVLAAENQTTIKVNGISTMLNAGEFYTTAPITAASLIEADKPVSVAQYAISEYCSDSRNQIDGTRHVYGDPDMVILNPLEYSIDKITLYSSTKLAISEQYLNVVIPSAKVSSFSINNDQIKASFNPIPTNPAYSYAQINLTGKGANFSLVADTGFNAIAYGFGSTESYAYSAGTSLASTTIVNALKQGTNETVDVACVQQAYDFNLLLPYIPTQLSWQVESGEKPFVVTNPSYKKVVVNNKQLYQFNYPANKTFASAGTKTVKVIASLPVNANVCSTTDTEVISYALEVMDLPVPEFDVPTEICAGNGAQFTFVNNNIGGNIAKWYWDFGDGTTSTDKNPLHTYAGAGTYKVKLSLISRSGCASDFTEKTVKVVELAGADFEMLDPLCSTKAIRFSDISHATQNVKTWLWDFGDGGTSSLQNPVYTFAKSGTYKIGLTITSQSGCNQTIQKSIQIYDPAVIDFADPASCISDMVSFEAIVKSGTVSSWHWDFGDGSVDPVEQTKAKPQHRYISAGNYVVTLNATTGGCVSTISKPITISGANPKVAFEVLDKERLCSNVPVSFKNTSSIAFGNIVKIEIIYDYKNASPSAVFTDINPLPDKVYTHQYPKSALNQNYQVVFRAYSGQGCFQESAPTTITVNGTPDIVFEDVPPVCADAPKIDLRKYAKELSGMLGAATFSGAGVTGNDFVPGEAGVGAHPVTFTFSSAKACATSISKVITVNPLPTVDAGTDVDILLAGEKQLNAKSTGKAITYKWFPATGLSNDSIANPIASPTETTKYILTVTSTDGCAVADEITVTVHKDPRIPNAFSPNNDGVNDTWAIKYLESFVKATIRIFNRGGQQVFFAERYTDAWDGKYKGIEVPVGVYYYIIEPNNGRNRYTGSVTVLR
ncbi:hypothetical protein BCY91_09960 [Pelobium manganitolerans]|uniref:PKD domain-containing protein n=1 Tax=Pelobium manganitolerans TaxID=1842495 RepID=A0A419S3W7_9SPHI|nr:PKD domain-containing protein [Pelobium manganitolerans]RKD13870.1 hypothetical protein BCY91_09960 [Pelobium manganitolerans]